ncbi:MAG: S-layer homology domain-containing protein, partial [Clostridia bacterium]|nr:S-layer homology domain-containing protein [Clostridia bacterium]
MKKTAKVLALLLTATILSATSVAATSASDFMDISEGDYFYDAVEWATAEGITYGVSDDLFDPQGKVTRAQVVTFLWRMDGSPEVDAEETFTDVSEGSWYEPAVLWAVKNDITAGTGDGMFSPDMVCDRAMCISLLYRLMDRPLDGIDPTAPIEMTDDMTMEDFA